MHKFKKIILTSMITIFLLISTFTLIPTINSQPLMEKLNQKEQILSKFNNKIVKLHSNNIENKNSWTDVIDIIFSFAESQTIKYSILKLIILILISPLILLALFAGYLIFIFDTIFDLIERLPDYDNILEKLRVIVIILISPFTFPIYLYYLLVLWFFHIIQTQ